MNKMIIVLLMLVVIGSTFCTATKKGTASKAATVSYTDNIQHIMTARCTPCHMPGGNKKQYNTYAAVKSDIDEIISRIQRNPGEKGFMPMKHPKLSADTINLFVQWKQDGLIETRP